MRSSATASSVAINFKLTVDKVEDPDGGYRAIVTLNGKYLPTKPY
jgi:cyanate lyase